MKSKNPASVVRLTSLALLAALVVVLQTVASGIRIGPVPISLTLVPIVIGAILFGWKKGAFLGGVFGITSMIKNTVNPNVTSFVFSPFVPVGDTTKGSPLAIIVCLLPRIMIGIVAGLLFKALSKTKLSKAISSGICGFCGALTNTILVMGGIYLFFGRSYSAAKDQAYETLIGTVMATITGIGITEALVSAVISAAVCVPLFKYMSKKD